MRREFNVSSGARDFFREQVEEYDLLHYGEGRSFMSERLERMIEAVAALGLPPGAHALEGGCGPGHFLAALVEAGFHTCGVDTSPQMLAIASRRIGNLGAGRVVRLAVADLQRLPFPDDSFDLVCTAGVVEYLEDDAKPLAELSRVLRPGGYLLYPITNSWSPLLYADALVEALKRRPRVLSAFNRWLKQLGRPPIRPRHFRVRTQSPARTRRLVTRLALELSQERYFYFLPLPHPLDRLFPRLSAAVGRRMDRLARTPLAPLAEGYLLVAQKPLASLREPQGVGERVVFEHSSRSPGSQRA
jgi:ubiquinone/menaquinone biosynthesis C-methylase UbiE